MKAGCLLVFLGLVGVPVMLLVGLGVAANWDAFETILFLAIAALVGLLGIGLYVERQKHADVPLRQWYEEQEQEIQGAIFLVPFVVVLLVVWLLIR